MIVAWWHFVALRCTSIMHLEALAIAAISTNPLAFILFSSRVPDHAGTSGAPTDGTDGDHSCMSGMGARRSRSTGRWCHGRCQDL